MDIKTIRKLPSDEKLLAINKMSSMTGFHASYCLLRVELDEMVEELLGKYDHEPLSSRDRMTLHMSILSCIREKFNGKKSEEMRDFVDFIETGFHRDAPGALRLRNDLADGILGVIGSMLKPRETTTLDQVAPLVSRLRDKALEHIESGELSPSQVLSGYSKLSEFSAKLSGELVEKKELEVSPSAAFKSLMSQDGILSEKFSGEVIEAKVEVIE